MPDPSRTKSTILLLVPDATARSVMEDILKREGYQVLGAGDLGAAMDRLKDVTPDLLITRTYLQNLSGDDAAKHLHSAKFLRSKCNSMKVLLIGGVLDDSRLFRGATLDGFEVFPKPYSAADLLNRVKEVLAAPAA